MTVLFFINIKLFFIGPLNSLLQEESDTGANSSESECVLSDPCNYLHEKREFASPRKVSFLQNENTDKFDVDGLKEKKKRYVVLVLFSTV